MSTSKATASVRPNSTSVLEAEKTKAFDYKAFDYPAESEFPEKFDFSQLAFNAQRVAKGTFLLSSTQARALLGMLEWLEKNLLPGQRMSFAPFKNSSAGIRTRFRQVFCDPAGSAYTELQRIRVLSATKALSSDNVFLEAFINTYNDPEKGPKLQQWGKDYRLYLSNIAARKAKECGISYSHVPR